ncbi:MAG: peroxiredoxin [Nocardioidaceae bacterium]
MSPELIPPEALPLEVGQAAPDFALRDQHGQAVALSSYLGRRVAVVFYPWAFSRVCHGELRALRDALPRFESSGISVLAVSCDAMFSLRAFAEAGQLTFPLLSDHWPHGAAARAYGVFDPATGAAKRSTFLVGPDGHIAWAVHNGLGEARDLEQYLQVAAGDPGRS